MKTKWRNSLLLRYLLIIVIAIMILPLLLLASFNLSNIVDWVIHRDGHGNEAYRSRSALISSWHDTAGELNNADSETIDEKLRSLKAEMPESTIFWVNGDGKTMLELPVQPDLPEYWTSNDAIVFMKKSYGADPFTVVAFIGNKPEQGFMVLQLPAALFAVKASNNTYNYVILLVLFVLFLVMSWSFIYRLRKRLIRLQRAMGELDVKGIPIPVAVKKEDEIGQLEIAFNGMIGELSTARQREEQEEALRKQLIANLSHDLRTPLTIIRSHAYSLAKEPLSKKGQESVTLIEVKSDDLNRLIDNLLSYNLVAAGKYLLERKETDMVRFIRTTVAEWFPALEAEGFEVEVDLPEHAVYWQVDPHWMSRILGNLLQNALRHAKSGRYVGVILEETGERRSRIVIEDKGPGMEESSEEKGAGIGLDIVALMSRELGLEYTLSSHAGGTRVCLTYGEGVDIRE
ncbi:HAMP domain-containing sensor histidine kinase [Gorillibacterium massiliense]|uniref:HAMP domain-containing sensor histidine kinase n=1 Tax=Gorillibacterium massiliense TaxID=1280390 RepID=UPI0004AF49E0|nr:sensor histidine kinase [Gorillibacterium massiliense]